MYRKKLMRVCLTGVMVVSIATANVAPVFAAEPVEKVETESDSWDSISGEINFRDTDNNESIFVQFNNEKVEDYRWGDDPKDTYEVLPAETVKKYLPEGYELVEGIYSVAGGDYFVDGDGDGIFHTREITEWVPEGYELQEVGDFQVELYKETPLQLSVTKIKEDKPETPDPEEPNKPEKPETPDQEKPEKPNKEDDKKEDKKDEKKNSPKTGDETNAAAAALPAGVSLAAILAVLVKKFK